MGGHGVHLRNQPPDRRHDPVHRWNRRGSPQPCVLVQLGRLYACCACSKRHPTDRRSSNLRLGGIQSVVHRAPHAGVTDSRSDDDCHWTYEATPAETGVVSRFVFFRPAQRWRRWIRSVPSRGADPSRARFIPAPHRLKRPARPTWIAQVPNPSLAERGEGSLPDTERRLGISAGKVAEEQTADLGMLHAIWHGA